MKSPFRKFLSQNRKSKQEHKKRGVQRRRRVIPALELLESRTLLAANGFLQGTVFFDANTNGQFDPSESGVPGATVQLFQGSVTPHQRHRYPVRNDGYL
jgi:hypothetical protein